LRLLVTVDWFLIRAIEKTAQTFQKLTGKTHYWVVRQLAVILILIYSWAAVSPLFAPKVPFFERVLATLFVGLMVWFFFIRWLLHVANRMEEVERAAFLRVSQGIANPVKIMPIFIIGRLLITSLVALDVYLTIISSALSSRDFASPILLLIVYLAACDPLPPAPSKVRQWLQKTRVLKTQEATN
jgi:hypothetical protein